MTGNNRERKGRRWFWPALVITGLLAAVGINAPGVVSRYYRLRYERLVAGLPAARAYTAADRVLVLSPHPDDESLATGGAIQQALTAGAQVFIAWMTSGDGFEWDDVLLLRRPRPSPRSMLALGRRRMEEARHAAAILGVAEDHLFFLGYPDRGLLRLFLDHYRRPYNSPHTHVDRVPYKDALSPGAPYTGAAWKQDVETLLHAVRPTVVLAPSPEDFHRDHRATAYLALRLLGERQHPPELRLWIIHGGVEWPLPKGWHLDLPLVPPHRSRGLLWQRVDLTPHQVAVKAEAIRAHRTQLAVIGRFMAAFARRNELVSIEPD